MLVKYIFKLLYACNLLKIINRLLKTSSMFNILLFSLEIKIN